MPICKLKTKAIARCMSIRFLLFNLVLLSWNSSIIAQNSLGLRDLNQHPVQVQPTQSLIWEVKRPGSEKVSYIYAILHIMPADNFFIPQGLQHIVDRTDKMVMEMNPSEADPDYLHRGSVPFDSTMDLILDRRIYAGLEAFIRDTLSSESLRKLEDRYSPRALGRQILFDYCMGYLEREEPVFVEKYLYNAIDKPLKTLNTGWTRTTWQEEEFSIREQSEELLYLIDQKDEACKVLDEYLMAYRRQDLDALWLLSQEVPDIGWNVHNFVEVRNQEWIKTLDWQMNYERLFIVVHAVQLPGEYGLLHMLRKEGYEVNPVYQQIPKYKNDPQRYAYPKD